jgi:flagellin
MISALNNISQLTAENALSNTQMNLQSTLTQLSTGLKDTSGSGDSAAISIANGLGVNINALTQSSQNASNGIGVLQTADGALSQVSSLLNQATTLAAEASNGNLSTAQSTALNTQFQSILSEITQIGSSTNFNGTAVFSATPQSVYLTDGTTGGSTTTTTTIGTLSATTLSLNGTALTSATGAQAALTAISAAVSTVAATRGSIGASVDQLTADVAVENTEVTNLTSAQNNIQDADIATTVANMTKYNVLQQTGMAALSQANQAQQSILKLLQ